MSKEHAMRTRLIHGDKHEMNPFGSLQMPIFQTSTYQFESTKQGADRFAGKEPGYIYARLGSPSTTHPIASECDWPKMVTRSALPKDEPMVAP